MGSIMLPWPSSLLLLLLPRVAHLLLQHADALVVPVPHLHQGALVLVHSRGVRAAAHREAGHHLLRKV